jgi:hypothetical protein
MVDPQTWKRDLVFTKGTFVTTFAGVPAYQAQGCVGGQLTISRRNKQWPLAQRLIRSNDPGNARIAKLLAKQDLGWGFTTTKNAYREIPFMVNWTSSTGNRSASGKLNASSNNVTAANPVWPALSLLDNAYMVGAGTIAIARCQPSNPAANMSIALAELLRERPRLPGRTLNKRTAKKLSSYADEYLNYVFGIAPLIGDAKDLYDAMSNSEAILSQYHRDSGQHVRRGYVFEPTKDVVVEELGLRSVQPAPASYHPWFGTYPLTLETTTTRKLWFKGCFTYTIPGMDNILDRVRRGQQELNRLYGIKITPDVVYALTPYSWLADWFGSIGSALENASNFYLSNQVMHYGYIMATQRIVKKYTLHTASNPYIGYDLVQEFETVTKQRHKATPYGFGLNPSTFTDQQWAILAALGISRGPKFLGVDQ